MTKTGAGAKTLAATGNAINSKLDNFIGAITQQHIKLIG